ncbi:MAG: hypothetical protein M9949_00180 [Candidatus Kapabacteria bacterium]|nr:hypothetical protein [Candidatus Kapabacteria bacterium]
MKFLISIFLLLFSFGVANADFRATNYQIIDSLASEYARQIASEVKTQGLSGVNLKISSHQLAKFSELHFIEHLSDSDIKISDEAGVAALEVNLGEVIVRYLPHEDSDSLKRMIFYNCSSILNTGNSTTMLSKFDKSYSDIIGRDEVAAIQNFSFPFTIADVPDRNLSLFDKLIKPVVYITTAAITVLLLFTVRSN